MVLEEIADAFVGGLQLGDFAETLAVFGIEDDEAGLMRDGGVGEIAGVEFDEVFDAGGGGVLFSGVNGLGVDIGGDDAGGGGGLLGWFAGLGAEGLPAGIVEVLEVHEAEAGTQEAGRALLGDEGGFDGEGAAAAHGGDEGLPAVVAGGEDDAGGEGLAERGLVGHFAVAAVGDFAAGGVEVEPGAVVFPEELEDQAVAVGAGVGAFAGLLEDAVHDGVLDFQAGEHGVVDGGGIDAGDDGEVAVRGDDVLPGQGEGVDVEVLRGAAVEFLEQEHDIQGRAEVEVPAHGVGEGGG